MISKIIPIATYRIQFNRNFKLLQGQNILEYLHQLGISDIYSSPLFAAEPNSAHGYDVINPSKLNPEITNEPQLRKFAAQLKQYKMRLLLDIVPNHMSASKHNRWWQDVLKHRQKSPFAKIFDINWKNFSYRRFFDINELVCLRMERVAAFNIVHQYLFKLIKARLVQALRVDHIDGIYDPYQYLQKLQLKTRALLNNQPYLVVEKILGHNETLPSYWPVSGTTGYDFLNAVNALFIDATGYEKLLAFYKKSTGRFLTWWEVYYQSKRKVIDELFAQETDKLTKDLMRIIQYLPEYRGINAQLLRQTLIELTACLAVYRTYINPVSKNHSDLLYLNQALNKASKTLISKCHPIIQFFKKLFSEQLTDNPHLKKLCLHWIMQWQQFTGPVMAKGFEDTTCYDFNPLISLNEVGSSMSIAQALGKKSAFHFFIKRRQKYFPHSLNASSTHDTKHSEDMRARINVLSELTVEWQMHFKAWQKISQPFKKIVNGVSLPDANTEFLLYQSLLGAWPINFNRIKIFLIKAIREAKINSTWSAPNELAEQAILSFTRRLLKSAAFLESFIPFQRKLNFFGMLNSLSETLLKITLPGVPDFYQGCENWNYSLVDPDNRRPISFYKNSLQLHKISDKKFSKNFPIELSKLFLIHTVLQFRTQHPLLFSKGKYIPLEVLGKDQNSIIAFARVYEGQWVIVVASRFLTKHIKIAATMNQWSSNHWHNTYVVLPKSKIDNWREILSAQVIVTKFKQRQFVLSVAEILKNYPVALLSMQD